MNYDTKYDGYDRVRCDACHTWIPWPALDDHACPDAGLVYDQEPDCEHGLSAWLCAGPMHYPV